MLAFTILYTVIFFSRFAFCLNVTLFIAIVYITLSIDTFFVITLCLHILYEYSFAFTQLTKVGDTRLLI